MRVVSSLVLICTLVAAEGDASDLRFGTLRVKGPRVVGTILQEGEPEARTATVHIHTAEGVEELAVPVAGRETLFRFEAGGEPTRVALDSGKPIRIQEVHRQPLDPLLHHLLLLADPVHKGRVAGTMESYKLANELRGALFRAGASAIAWPTVPLPQPEIHGTRELTLLKGDKVVARLDDSYFPFYLSARPASAAVFDRVLVHPAESVKGALVILPEMASVETARAYADQGAAVVAVRNDRGSRHEEADWSNDPENGGAILRTMGSVLAAPYVYLAPEAVEACVAHDGKGVLKFAATMETRSTSNIVGLFGNPRERGILLSAPWDGTEKDAFESAVPAAVLLWVAKQLARDEERGVLKRPVMLVLYGASALGDCGDWQFFRILESPDTPVARPRMELHLSRIAGPALEVEAGSDLNERDLGALQKVIEAEGLMRPTVRKGERSTRLALASSGAAGGTGFAAVDLDSVRRTARAVYRLVRELASE